MTTDIAVHHSLLVSYWIRSASSSDAARDLLRQVERGPINAFAVDYTVTTAVAEIVNRQRSSPTPPFLLDRLVDAALDFVGRLQASGRLTVVPARALTITAAPVAHEFGMTLADAMAMLQASMTGSTLVFTQPGLELRAAVRSSTTS